MVSYKLFLTRSSCSECIKSSHFPIIRVIRPDLKESFYLKEFFHKNMRNIRKENEKERDKNTSLL